MNASPSSEAGSPCAATPSIDQTLIGALRLQRFLGWLFVLPLGFCIVVLIRFYYRLRLDNLKEIRQQFRALTRERSPIIICANHLTMVDSVIIIWALSSLWDYFMDYRLFSWNIPAFENYKKKPIWRIITYLAKCISIDRAGGAKHLDSILARLEYLLMCGEVCTVFPEGTRSRSGRVSLDAVTYGVGKLVKAVPRTKVLCIYLRGESQETYSNFPRRGEVLYMSMKLIAPQSSATGLRAVREYSVQAIQTVKAMEDEYFAARS